MIRVASISVGLSKGTARLLNRAMRSGYKSYCEARLEIDRESRFPPVAIVAPDIVQLKISVAI